VSLSASLTDLIKLGLSLANGDAVSGMRQSMTRLAFRVVLSIIAIGFAMAALVCALAALWIYLIPLAGTVGTPLIIAGAFLFLAAIALVAAAYQRETKPVAEPVPQVGVADLLNEATRQLKEQKVPVLIATLLTGLIAGTREK